MGSCPHCGGAGHTRSANLADGGGDADAQAIAELTEQARTAPPELAAMIRAARDQLRLERRGAGLVGARLARIYKVLVEAIRSHLARFPGDSVSERWLRAQINADWLGRALGQAGLNQLILDVERIQVDLAVAAKAAVEAGGAVAPGLDLAPVMRLAQMQSMELYWRRDVVQAVSDTIEQGLVGSMIGETLDEATARVARDLNKKVSKAKTDARTALSSFSRAVSSATGALIGAQFYRWGGPNDPLARGFCRALVGKVISREQMGRLDNAQGLPIETGAGGYNCRHAAQPISETIARAMDLPFATDEDIAAANAAARKERGGRR
jgi:hypothetical protein